MLVAALKSSRKGQPGFQWMHLHREYGYQQKERRHMKRIKQRKPYQRPNIICLRLSDSELSLLDTHADQCQATRSEYIRNLILEKKMTPKYQIVIDSVEIQKILSEYGKIGSNLNQIAKYFNSGGERSLAMEEEIRRSISELFMLRKEVLRLAGDFSGSNKTHKKP